MNRLIRFALFSVALLASIAFVGCTEDVTIDLPATSGGEGALFDFVVDDLDVATEDQESSISTKATTTIDPAAVIKNMWVVQYDKDNTFLKEAYFSSYKEVSEMGIVSDASYIVFIANTFNTKLITSNITLDNLKALSTTNVKTNNNSNVILNGTYDATSGDNTVHLSRNVARFDLKVTRTWEDDTYTLSDITIYNVADSSPIYTNYEGANFKAKSTTSYKLTSDELTSATSTDGARLFLHVNEQGENTENETSKDKVTNAPTDATYVVLTYTENFFERKYTFYLGKNMITDYNISPNFAYSCTLNINDKGNHMTDSRIEAGLAYIPMSTAADIDRWKKNNASKDYYADALANYNTYGKDYIDFKYTVGELKGTNWMPTSAVINVVDPDGDGIVNKNMDSHSITTTTDVSDDVLPQLQNILGTGVELPTQKELMYMWVFMGSNSFQPLDYWSGMVYSNNDSFRWYIDMENGVTFGVTAGNNRYARAVKKIALP